MIIEIGGGTKPLASADYILDPKHSKPEDSSLMRRKAEIRYGPWPFDDNVADLVYASHVLEHIASGEDRIGVFNEAHRVLKPGGLFDIIVPLVGYNDSSGTHMTNGWWPWADPTHISFWWFPESLLYFCRGDFKPNADYGIKDWDLVSWQVSMGWEGAARLIKV